VIARTVHGLEWVCAAEVSSLIGAEDRVELSRREVTFEFGALGPGLLGLRTADDVHLKVGAVQGVGSTKEVPPAVGHAAAALDWESAVEQLRAVRQIPDAVRFDVVASLEGQRSYNRYAVEAAIGSSLAAVLPGVFLERAPSGAMAGDPDLTVRVFVRGDQAVLAVRLGPRPLHRRAYKTDTGPGTLHPPAAAALAMISAPETGTLLDPFCGDGTIAIEAAVIRPKLRVVASDFDPQRVENTRRNAGRAGVDIKVSCADAGALSTPHGAVDAVLTNPPWNLAVDWSGQLSANGQRFWDMLPSLLASFVPSPTPDLTFLSGSPVAAGPWGSSSSFGWPAAWCTCYWRRRRARRLPRNLLPRWSGGGNGRCALASSPSTASDGGTAAIDS